MRESRGFTLLEVIVALAVVGLGVTALMGALSQNARARWMTRSWAEEESRAADLLMDELNRWQHLRSNVARRQFLRNAGDDAKLGDWTFEAVVKESQADQALALYHLTLRWQKDGRGREVSTDAVLRIPQGL
ncbi:type II secretion system protein [Geothrix sp. 21YS21S-4]|uniref:type II secretion system protein n=1 Tax=Geothrix sp. 21YS21S-4 TaxID=3068889 RepID=UPI0027B89C8D|nr:prepilin-type N-terminal cleavage/methylation domain-containing protein [Geothrix sp. 21YS21S-4]